MLHLSILYSQINFQVAPTGSRIGNGVTGIETRTPKWDASVASSIYLITHNSDSRIKIKLLEVFIIFKFLQVYIDDIVNTSF